MTAIAIVEDKTIPGSRVARLVVETADPLVLDGEVLGLGPNHRILNIFALGGNTYDVRLWDEDAPEAEEE